MSPLRCTGMKSSPTSSCTEWICSGKNTVDSAEERRRRGSDRKEKRQREKRVMTCIIMAPKKRASGKKAHHIRPSRTDAGFCSVSDTFFFTQRLLKLRSCSAFIIFENNSPSPLSVLKQPEVLFKGTPPEVLPRRLVCRTQLHMQASHGESVGSFTHPLLSTPRGQRHRRSPLFFSLSLSRFTPQL